VQLPFFFVLFLSVISVSLPLYSMTIRTSRALSDTGASGGGQLFSVNELFQRSQRTLLNPSPMATSEQGSRITTITYWQLHRDKVKRDKRRKVVDTRLMARPERGAITGPRATLASFCLHISWADCGTWEDPIPSAL
jgi:hypothetical protein